MPLEVGEHQHLVGLGEEAGDVTAGEVVQIHRHGDILLAAGAVGDHHRQLGEAVLVSETDVPLPFEPFAAVEDAGLDVTAFDSAFAEKVEDSGVVLRAEEGAVPFFAEVDLERNRRVERNRFPFDEAFEQLPRGGGNLPGGSVRRERFEVDVCHKKILL